MKKYTSSMLTAIGLVALSLSVAVLGAAVPVQAQSDATTTYYRGAVTQVDFKSLSFTMKTDEGAVYTFRVARFADLDDVAVGDRVQAEAVPTWGMVLSLKKIAPAPRAGAAATQAIEASQSREDNAPRAILLASQSREDNAPRSVIAA